MAQDKEIAQFLLEDGTPVLIEVEESDSPSVKRAANVDIGQEIVQAKQTFEAALGQVMPVASAALKRIRTGLTTPADEVELKFGVKISSEVGAIIAKGSVCAAIPNSTSGKP